MSNDIFSSSNSLSSNKLFKKYNLFNKRHRKKSKTDLNRSCTNISNHTKTINGSYEHRPIITDRLDRADQGASKERITTLSPLGASTLSINNSNNYYSHSPKSPSPRLPDINIVPTTNTNTNTNTNTPSANTNSVHNNKTLNCVSPPSGNSNNTSSGNINGIQLCVPTPTVIISHESSNDIAGFVNSFIKQNSEKKKCNLKKHKHEHFDSLSLRETIPKLPDLCKLQISSTQSFSNRLSMGTMLSSMPLKQTTTSEDEMMTLILQFIMIMIMKQKLVFQHQWLLILIINHKMMMMITYNNTRS